MKTTGRRGARLVGGGVVAASPAPNSRTYDTTRPSPRSARRLPWPVPSTWALFDELFCGVAARPFLRDPLRDPGESVGRDALTPSHNNLARFGKLIDGRRPSTEQSLLRLTAYIIAPMVISDQ